MISLNSYLDAPSAHAYAHAQRHHRVSVYDRLLHDHESVSGQQEHSLQCLDSQ